MEVRALIHASVAAAYVLCVLWKLKGLRGGGGRRPGASSLLLAGALALGLWAFLNFTVCADACAASLIGCSVMMICVSARRETLLPTHNRAVLVTGETHTHTHLVCRHCAPLRPCSQSRVRSAQLSGFTLNREGYVDEHAVQLGPSAFTDLLLRTARRTDRKNRKRPGWNL